MRPGRLDDLLALLRRELEQRGFAVRGMAFGPGGELCTRCLSPLADLTIEDALDRPPAGHSVPFGSFRLVLRSLLPRMPAPRSCLSAAAEALGVVWDAGLLQWFERVPWDEVERSTEGLARVLEARLVPGEPFWGSWRLDRLDRDGERFLMRFSDGDGCDAVFSFGGTDPQDTEGTSLPTPLGPFKRVAPVGNAGPRDFARIEAVLRFVVRRTFVEGMHWVDPPGEPQGYESPPALPVIPAVRPVSHPVRGSRASPLSGRARKPANQVRIRLITTLDSGVLDGIHHRPPFASLGPARLAGYLKKQGYSDCRHLDMNVSLTPWLRDHHGEIDWARFADRELVDRHLSGTVDPDIRETMDRLLDVASVGDADVFGLSLARQHHDHPLSDLQEAFNLCLVHALRERHTECVTVIGGLNHLAFMSKRDVLLALLSRCASLDFVVEGPGEQAMFNIAEAVFRGRGFDKTGQAHDRRGDQYYLFPSGEGPRPGRSTRKKEIRLHGRFALAETQSLPKAVPDFTNAEDYRWSGHDMAEFYGFQEPVRAQLGPHLGRTVLPLTLQFMTGCSSRCAFCNSAGVPVAALPVSEVVRQIIALRDRFETTHFIFTNNAINWSRDYAMDFADELCKAGAGIRWTDSLKLNCVDAALADRLRESGFIRADIGVETASNRLRRILHKPLSTRQVLDRLRLLHDNGIWCDINMIVGFPHEQPRDIEENRRFLLMDAAEYYFNCALDPYYLIDVSPMGREPDRYGIRIRSELVQTPGGMRKAFDEIGGPTFEQRLAAGRHMSVELRDEVILSRRHITAYEHNIFPYHLLFFLYDVYGHEGKRAIQSTVSGLLEGLAERQNPLMARALKAASRREAARCAALSLSGESSGES